MPGDNGLHFVLRGGLVLVLCCAVVFGMELGCESEELVDYSSDPTKAYQASPTLFVSSCTATPLSMVGVGYCGVSYGLDPTFGAFCGSISGDHEIVLESWVSDLLGGIWKQVSGGGLASDIVGTTICSGFGSWAPGGCQVGYGLDPMSGVSMDMGSLFAIPSIF